MTTNPTTVFTNLDIRKVSWVDYTAPGICLGVDHIAVISDIHLGHAVVAATKMTAELDLQFPEARLAALKVIIISGDLFDKRLPHDGEDAFIIALWMESFLIRCKRHNVAIRILEGTPSHDNRQSRWMPNYNRMMNLGLDIKYYPEITIDELYEGGPTVLYIPDEMNHDATETWKQVCELMRTRGIEKVDFAIMHGFFTFQSPVVSMSSHNEEWYHSIVRFRIVIGHHHTHVNVGIIVVPGSPDRHKHNQEEDKGHYQFSYSKEKGAFDDLFIVNPYATIFKSFEVAGKTYSQVVAAVRKASEHPDGSHFRLLISRKDEVYTNLSRLKNEFPHFKFSTKVLEAQTRSRDDGGLAARPLMTSIRPDTIRSLVMPKVADASAAVMAVIEKALAD